MKLVQSREYALGRGHVLKVGRTEVVKRSDFITDYFDNITVTQYYTSGEIFRKTYHTDGLVSHYYDGNIKELV